MNFSTRPLKCWRVGHRFWGERLLTVESGTAFEVDSFASSVVLHSPSRTLYRNIRMGVDILAASILLVIAAPVMAAAAIAVRLDSPGPALFRQRRVGLGGRVFSMYKFRTMHVSSPVSSLKVSSGSPLITRAGRWLRASALDELPQLLNVLRGEMAIIGPRPEQVELLPLYEPWQLERLTVLPGITGWWQVHHRDDSPLHHNVDKDIYYIRNQSLALDLRILSRTASIMVRGLLVRRPAPNPAPPSAGKLTLVEEAPELAELA